MVYSDKVLDHYENPRNVDHLIKMIKCRISMVGTLLVMS